MTDDVERSREGIPDEVDCDESLRRLYVYLDGELTPERRALVRSHLDACGGCLEMFDFEAELRAHISSCCTERRLPEGLRERVLAVLADRVDDDGAD